MITQIGGLNSIGLVKDPRRTSRHARFKNESLANIPYKGNYDEEDVSEQRKVVKTSILILLGSVLFMMGYFVLSGLKGYKK